MLLPDPLLFLGWALQAAQNVETFKRVARIELATSVWKTEVLPLNYARQSDLYSSRAFSRCK
jgi:hypothetical protein